jgi:peptidoglycan/LPS O-acetylase OafA/YrhL
MRYKALDSWRGICALMVVLFHAEGTGPIGASALIKGSYLFVDFFFVLSGFVISTAYASRIGTLDDVRRFLLRRFGRVWPLHAAVIAALLGLELAKLGATRLAGVQFNSPPFSGTLALSGLLPSLLLIHAMGLLPGLTWNVPSWSIGAEYWTYVAFALLVWWRRDRLTALPVMIAGAAALTLTMWSPTLMDVTYNFGLVRCLYGFFAGVLVHRLLAAQTGRGLALGTGTELAAVAAAGTFVAVAHDTRWEFFSPVVFAGVIVVFAAARGVVTTLLETRPFQRLGAWSYSVYMIHLFILGIIHTASRLLGPRLERTAAGTAWDNLSQLPGMADARMLAFVAVVVAASSLTYAWIELPGQRFVNGLAGRRDPR